LRNAYAHGKVLLLEDDNTLIWISIKEVEFMDFSKMSGYEFEDYIAKMLRQKGFSVTQTSYSGDGGVDMIAMFDKPLFSGKYIVQCKNYTGLVGQPEIRDLFGVVMAESANKGIIITPSDFTEQAYDFARGKQLELINGNTLKGILSDLPRTEAVGNEPPFASRDNFNFNRFEYLKKKIEEEPKEESHYRDLYCFLYDYICLSLVEEEYGRCGSSLFKETLSLIQAWKNRCYKGKSKSIERTMCDLLTSNLLLMSGEISQAVELLICCGTKYCMFSEREEFWPYVVRGGDDSSNNTLGNIRHEESNISNRSFFAANLYSAFKCIGFKRGTAFVTSQLKPQNSAEDYIECSFIAHTVANQDMYKLYIHGIPPYELYNPTQYDTPSVSNRIIDELEQFCQWYKRFEDGMFDDRFLITNTKCKTIAYKQIVTSIESYQKSAISFSKLRNAFCTKTDEEICRELDIVFDNHGL
jgi:hypothetical protein